MAMIKRITPIFLRWVINNWSLNRYFRPQALNLIMIVGLYRYPTLIMSNKRPIRISKSLKLNPLIYFTSTKITIKPIVCQQTCSTRADSSKNKGRLSNRFIYPFSTMRPVSSQTSGFSKVFMKEANPRIPTITRITFSFFCHQVDGIKLFCSFMDNSLFLIGIVLFIQA